MKIETLEFSGLRSHRGNPPTTLTLSDKKLVAIVGPTGAGKSSLLEAICFVLFGEATFGGKVYKELSTDGCSEIDVRMVFTVGDERYQLVRVVGPNRRGDFGTKEAWLRRVGEDGEVLSQKDGVRKVDDGIRTLLGGMDREQFCQAILLAQNRFAQLLEADERTRNELLDILLGLTALERARKAIQTTQKAAARNIDRLEDKRHALPDNPAAHARDTKTQAKVMADLATRAEAGAETLGELGAQARRLTEEGKRLEDVAALRVAGIDGTSRLKEILATLEPLVTEDERLAMAITGEEESQRRANEHLEQMATALQAVEEKHGRAGVHDVVAQQLHQLAGLFGDRPTHAKALEECVEVLNRLATEVSAAEETLSAASTAKERCVEAERLAIAKQTATRETLAGVERDTGAAKTIAERLGARADEVGRVLPGLVASEGELGTAREALETATARHTAAAQTLKEAQQASHAAAASHECRPGDPCPVCHRELPAGWTAPESTNLEETAAAETQTRDQMERAIDAHRRHSEIRIRLVGAFAAGVDAFAEVYGELVAHCDGRLLPSPPAYVVTELPDDVTVEACRSVADQTQYVLREIEAWNDGLGKLLVAPQEAAGAADAEVVKAGQACEDAERAEREASTRLHDLRAKKAAAEERQRGAQGALADTERRIGELVDQVPDPWRALVDATAASPVEPAQRAVSNDKDQVEKAAKDHRDAGALVQERGAALTALKSEKSQTVDAPRAACSATLATLSGAIAELATIVDVAALEPVDPDGTPAALLAAARNLEAAAAVAVGAATTKASNLRGEVAALVEPARSAVLELVALKAVADPEGRQIAASPDPAAPLAADTIAAVQQLVGAAKTAASTVAAMADQAKADVKTAKEIDERIAGLIGWRADLARAVDVLKKENFPAWARNERIAELIQRSSELLSQMTGGRYRFDHRLSISDEIAGIVRSASTLSGGEKFEAALALALGVAEIAGRSGIRFDTLFLDEGFAGLDQANLDRALDALETEVDAGRCIVLITHIGAVAERIRDVLYVSSDGLGTSAIRWLNEDERSELGADLDLAVG